MSRCYNVRVDRYPQYGGRGIRVVRRWHKFVNFFADMGLCPDGSSIERVNNNKGYSPSNCIWATPTTQGRNKRNNRLLTHAGETLPLSGWAERTGLKLGTLWYRWKAGWAVEDILTTPARLLI